MGIEKLRPLLSTRPPLRCPGRNSPGRVVAMGVGALGSLLLTPACVKLEARPAALTASRVSTL